MDTEKWNCLNIDVLCLIKREIKQDPAKVPEYWQESCFDIQHFKDNKIIEWDHQIYLFIRQVTPVHQ